MSYRNDHEAAVARIDVLERENERLARENSQLRAGVTPTPMPLAVPERPRTSAHRSEREIAHIVIGLVCLMVAVLVRMFA